MTITLTPHQQAALDQFVQDAAEANAAAAANAEDQVQLFALKAKAAIDAQAAIDDHQRALASAQAFIDTMISPTNVPAPAIPA